MGFTIDQASRLYGIPVIDYLADEGWAYGREGNWLLIAAGTGLMLSVMDQEPRFRYCIDVDSIKDALDYRLGQWLILMESLVDKIAVAGWYSNPTNAGPLLNSLRKADNPKELLVYLGATVTADTLHEFEYAGSLAEFLARLRMDAISGA